MAMHLFSTPVECTNCGTVVDDPTVDRCPSCDRLLKERRTPGRLAGVERRYGNIRFLLGFLRFLAVITLLVGLLMFLFVEEAIPWTSRIMIALGGLLVAAGLFVIAALFEVALDVEENTRATFKVQQLILNALEPTSPPPDQD